jgi:nitrite reductase/ring-hydroxylating ferredoxin subunit
MASALELSEIDRVKGLAARILNGEVVVLRGALQQAGLYDPLVQASLDGIRAVVGPDRANAIRDNGFDRIHETVSPGEIPAVTDAVYERVTDRAHDHLKRLLPRVFSDADAYYYERSPNVRFHIPYDQAAEHRRQYETFVGKRGEGKITAHGPHRDPWVDCPDNAINVWIAIGPVQRGNGLTVFLDEYRNQFTFKDGYIDWGVKLTAPLTFDLAAGDAVLFHSNHLHGSELNRTDRTRYVISYRITLGKPHYPHGHYHHYLHGGLADGPLRRFAGVPQNLQWSFVRYQVRRIRDKLLGRGKMSGADAEMVQARAHQRVADAAGTPIAIDEFAVGSIRAVSESVCVARLGEDRFAAVGRRCSHMGGDLAGGWIEDGKIVCPLHSLPFDPASGSSPCRSVKPLRQYRCEVRGGQLHVDPGPVRQAAVAGGRD